MRAYKTELGALFTSPIREREPHPPKPQPQKQGTEPQTQTGTRDSVESLNPKPQTLNS